MHQSPELTQQQTGSLKWIIPGHPYYLPPKLLNVYVAEQGALPIT